MTHHVNPTHIVFGNFQRAYSVENEAGVYIDVDAPSLEELRAKSAEVEQHLGSLGVAYSKLTGSELVNASVTPDYDNNIHMSLEI